MWHPRSGTRAADRAPSESRPLDAGPPGRQDDHRRPRRRPSELASGRRPGRSLHLGLAGCPDRSPRKSTGSKCSRRGVLASRDRDTLGLDATAVDANRPRVLGGGSDPRPSRSPAPQCGSGSTAKLPRHLGELARRGLRPGPSGSASPRSSRGSRDGAVLVRPARPSPKNSTRRSPVAREAVRAMTAFCRSRRGRRCGSRVDPPFRRGGPDSIRRTPKMRLCRFRARRRRDCSTAVLPTMTAIVPIQLRPPTPTRRTRPAPTLILRGLRRPARPPPPRRPRGGPSARGPVRLGRHARPRPPMAEIALPRRGRSNSWSRRSPAPSKILLLAGNYAASTSSSGAVSAVGAIARPSPTSS